MKKIQVKIKNETCSCYNHIVPVRNHIDALFMIKKITGSNLTEN